MTRLWPNGEAIKVNLNTQGLPAQFTWQGQVHRVQHIRQRWQVDTDWWHEEGQVWREAIAVTTTDGLFCVLYYDIQKRAWFLEKLYD